MFDVVMTYLAEDEEVRVVTQTTGVTTQMPQRVLDGDCQKSTVFSCVAEEEWRSMR